MRWSRYFLQTVREVPGDAEAVSHVLMTRAGMIRRVAAGIYSLTPLGLRSHRKTERIVREEIDAAGGLEVELPTSIRASSGRRAAVSRYRRSISLSTSRTQEGSTASRPRRERDDDGPAGVTSYASSRDALSDPHQVPRRIRRASAHAGREFLMYYVYSFDVDPEAWTAPKGPGRAYRRVFERAASTSRVADSGALSVSASEEFMVLADTGEDAVVRCAACGYGANLEKAETGARAAPWKDETETPLVEVATPGKGGIADVVDFLGITASRMIKCLVYETEQGFVVALLRGDLDVNEVALRNSLGVEHVALASEDKVEKATGAPVGYVGPHKLPRENVRVVADESIGMPSTPSPERAAGLARRRLRAAPRRERPEWAPFAQARAGDPCPRCGKPLDIARGIEVGHIFKLGTKYSTALKCEFTDEKGEQRPAVMGTYGIGVGRTMAAAIEQHHDADGIVWPLPLAPFEVALVSLNASDEATRREADALYESLQAAGLEVFYDDRDERPGVKFKDGRRNTGGTDLSCSATAPTWDRNSP